MKHELKIKPEYFNAWMSGEKTFELRRDDRQFAAGDELQLREYLGERIVVDQLGRPVEGPDGAYQFTPIYSGREISVRVISVLRNVDGLEPGYAILACKLLPDFAAP